MDDASRTKYQQSEIFSPFIVLNELSFIPSTKTKVPIKCPKCGQVKEILLCSHLQTIRKNNMQYLCHKCSINSDICSKNAKALWNDPVKAQVIRSQLKSEERRSFLSVKSKKFFADPVLKERWMDTLNRGMISINSKKMWSSKDYRIKIKKSFSERCKKQWQDPEYRLKMNTYRATDEYRKKMDELRHSDAFKQRMKKVWADPIYREKMEKLAIELWSNDTFRIKMADVRLSQPRTSTQQKVLYSILNDLKVKYLDDQSHECKVGYYTFDCRINPQSGVILKNPLLIEVNGDYWHNLPRTIAKDKSKSTYLKTYFPEFDLKYLWEHEFNNKDRVVSLLKYWLGMSKNELRSFSFSDVQERVIEASEAELFISKYHYAGRLGRSGLNLGYFLGDELVAVIVYSNPVRQEVATKQGYLYREVLELSRLAIHPDFQVKNFASFLISISIKSVRLFRPGVRMLVSFADSTHNHYGVIYKASNWRLDGEVPPDYWYADDRGYICHKKTLWNHAKKMSMTESEYCEKFGYVKVWGKGKFRYVFDLCV